MPLDISTIAAVRDELNERIQGAKIDKIQQPQRDLIIFSLRGIKGDPCRLLMSVCPGDIRVHLTGHTFENPASPPMFCMLLRKHLAGAGIDAIEQPPGDRMLVFTFKTSSAMGDISIKRLVLELFGHIPNIILTDGEGIIIDCLRRIGGDADGRRMILPGLRYRPPGPVSFSTDLTADKNKAAGNVQGGSISETLDATYTFKAKQEGMRRRSAELRKTMKSAQKRITRKLTAQRAELIETEERDSLRQRGDIIMANMHRIGKGDEVLVAEDFYAGSTADTQSVALCEIILDPLKTPQQNAAGYYKAYTKARNAEVHLKEQIASGEAELTYIESVIEQLERAESEQDLQDIRDELTQAKYLKAGTRKNRKAKVRESMPLEFKSSAGMQILAGRNNIQNDRLTFKTAAKSDIWLHAQKIHGAHVIIRTEGKPADDVTLREAAEIAAYHCAARNAGKVPVDYTFVRYVKKQPGARPGMVIYTEYKTITVEPGKRDPAGYPVIASAHPAFPTPRTP